MRAGVLIAAALTLGISGAAPVPQSPSNLAPHPREVKPDLSLVVINLVKREGDRLERVQRIGFRNGQPWPTETLWEGDWFIFLHGVRVVKDRYLVTGSGWVFDAREGKVVSGEEDGRWGLIEDTKVTYWLNDPLREKGVFTFEYDTGKYTRVGKGERPWFTELQSSRAVSPDWKSAVRWENGDELILYREGEKPKLLGKGFKMEEDPQWTRARSLDLMYFPVLWLDNETLLTQRGHGKLVTVTLGGKVTEILTITGAPKFASPSLHRDADGAIFYRLENTYYRIDLEKKTAKKSEWKALGHGFEATWDRHEKLGHTLRYKGEVIGQGYSIPYYAKTAPGYLALPVSPSSGGDYTRYRVAVWSEATGEWTTIESDSDMLSERPIAGWVR